MCNQIYNSEKFYSEDPGVDLKRDTSRMKIGRTLSRKT